MRVTLALLIAAAGLSRAQQPAGGAVLEFEVASVKPSPPMTGNSFTVRMGGDAAIQNFTNVSLRSLILRAYAIEDYQLEGPEWMQATLFDVSARLPEGASTKQVPVMMQKLLADRFHLTVHRETRELPMYALILAKGGIHTQAPDKRDAPKVQKDGTVTMTGGLSGHGIINLTGMEMSTESLAEMLSRSGDRPVLDRTGLSGSYQFKMHWSGSEDGPSLSDALQENLGLKLESRKAPIEILVIDHVDKEPVVN